MFRDIQPPFGGLQDLAQPQPEKRTGFFKAGRKLLEQISFRDALRSVAAKSLAWVLVFAISLSNIIFVKAPDLTSGFVLLAETNEERQALEQRLQEVERQIDSYEQGISDLQGQKKTLANEVKIMDSQMAKLNLQIKMIDLEIQRLGLRIGDLGVSIQGSETRIDKAKNVLTGSLQNVYETDQVSLMEMLVSGDNLSDFFEEVNTQTAIQVKIQEELDEIRSLKFSLENQQGDLIVRKEDQTSLLQLQESQRQELAAKKQGKDRLLSLTKGKESLYQELIRQSEKTAAEIRAQLYKLVGGGEIKFGDAVKYAEAASRQTGVRSALLLAVLDKESALGKNVGKCKYDENPYYPARANNKTSMHPTRDIPNFLTITKELGLDPNTMLVSCPIPSDGAYGGAMGFAQFLPSTWMAYKDRLAAMIGATPSPWNPRDAFLATAVYLADLGANKGGTENERIAAARYYAGGRWRSYLYSYGAKVIELASYYEGQLSILQKNAMLEPKGLSVLEVLSR